MQPPPGRFDGPPKEKVFNAPVAAVALAASMPLLFFFQERLPDQGVSMALAPDGLLSGGWAGLFTSMLIHGSWAHVGFNAVSALCFGPPVARLFPGARGALVFFAFYIACGAAAALGYALVHLDSTELIGGASGAVFGLFGAAIRLLGRKNGRLRALSDRRVVTTAVAIMAVNAVTGLIGFAPGVEGARIAWEAHAFGFLAGLLAIGPLSHLFGRPTQRFDSPADMGDRRF